MNVQTPDARQDDERYFDALADYMRRVDSGEEIDQEVFLTEHAEFADSLRAYFETESLVESLAGPKSSTVAMRDANDNSSLVNPLLERAVAGSEFGEATFVKWQDATGLPRNEDEDRPQIPEIFGRYRVLREIGRGGMGSVYLAHDTQLDREVALKIPKFAGDDEADMLARFYREARVAAKLRHTNVCPVYDVGEIDGRPFIAMAYIDGRPLKDFARSKKTQPERQVAVVIRKLALGLAEAHAHGIVHRDLKPANVMVDAKGEPVVMDFGLAQRLALSEAPLTESDAIIGTPAYMSPEQVEGNHTAIGPITDVYGLGVICYELLSGQVPFQGKLMKVLVKIVTETPIAPAQLRPGLDPRMEAICLKMMAKRQADRYQTMQEVAQACAEFLKSPALRIDNSPSLDAHALSIGFADLPPMSLTPEKTAADFDWTPPAPGEEIALPPLDEDLTLAPAHMASRQRGEKGTEISAGKSQGVPARFWIAGGATLSSLVLLFAVVAIISRYGKVETPEKSKENQQVAVTEPDQPKEPVVEPAAPVVSPPPVPERKSWHGWPLDAPEPALAPFDAAKAKEHQEAWAEYLKVPTEYSNSFGMRFRLIPPGEFQMGISREEADELLKICPREGPWRQFLESEVPRHKVVITKPYYLGVYEVTQRDYQAVFGRNPSFFSPRGQGRAMVAGLDTWSHPVEVVNWSDAAEFCLRLSQIESLQPCYSRAGASISPATGLGYRLPSEAEWDFAARGGTTTRFWNGDTEQELLQTEWFNRNSSGRTRPVGGLKANPFGLYDMLGNVCEYCQDHWDVGYYGTFGDKPAIDPTGVAAAPDSRTLTRGGSWAFNDYVARSAFRFSPEGRYNESGFRIALSVDGVRERMQAGPDDRERRAAFWALFRGGKIRIRVGGQEQEFTDATRLPSEKFELLEVSRPFNADWTGENLAVLAAQPSLQQLNLTNVAIPDSILRTVSDLPELRELHFTGTRLRGPGLESLRWLPKLNMLSIVQLDRTPGWGELVKELRGLENLELRNCVATSADLEALSQLPNLRRLNLSQASLDDDCVDSLAKLDKLSEISLAYSTLSESAAQELRKRLPDSVKLDIQGVLRDDLARALREGTWIKADLDNRAHPTGNKPLVEIDPASWANPAIALSIRQSIERTGEKPGNFANGGLELSQTWARLPEIQGRDLIVRARLGASGFAPTFSGGYPPASLILRESETGCYDLTLFGSGRAKLGRYEYPVQGRTDQWPFLGGLSDAVTPSTLSTVTLAVTGDVLHAWVGKTHLAVKDAAPLPPGGVAFGWPTGYVMVRDVEYQILEAPEN